MTIINYEKNLQSQLEELMIPYMAELGDDMSEDVIRRKIFPFIHQQFEKKIIEITLAMDGEAAIGFSVFQIDTAESDWCKRPGWGFIREFYIKPSQRKHGFGKQLALDTEQRLRNMGARQLYLTSHTAVPFWESCGWKNTGEICSNDCYILVK